jgi:hypothetical protein
MTKYLISEAPTCRRVGMLSCRVAALGGTVFALVAVPFIAWRLLIALDFKKEKP